MVEKTVIVAVKIGENGGKLKNEGPPSFLWSWRKFGQKPIKGSPYPRGITSAPHTTNLTQSLKEQQLAEVSEPIKAISDKDASEEHVLSLQSPLISPQKIIINQEDLFTWNQEKADDMVGFPLDEEPLSCIRITTTSSTPKSE